MEEHSLLKLTTYPGDDQPEESHSSPSQATEDAPQTAAVWHGHHIQTRQGNAFGWCSQLTSFQNQHRDQVWPQCWCHIHVSLQQEPPDQGWCRDTTRPHPFNSPQIDLEWLARQRDVSPGLQEMTGTTMMNSQSRMNSSLEVNELSFHHPTETLSWTISTKAMQETTRHCP